MKNRLQTGKRKANIPARSIIDVEVRFMVDWISVYNIGMISLGYILKTEFDRI